MKLLCTKVRETTAAYTAADRKATPVRAYEVFFAAVVLLGEAGEIMDAKLTVVGASCPYTVGQSYELTV